MRRALDGLYAVSGALAALFLALIFAIIIIQVGMNSVDRIASLIIGKAFGLSIPSYADIAGFFLAATSFLGLAATLRSGDLIRVNLLLQRMPTGLRRLCELWATGIGALISTYATWYSVLLAMDAYRYNELSTGVVAIPMWIPQISMIVGLAILTIALVDAFISCLLHGTLIEDHNEVEIEHPASPADKQS